MVNKFEIGQDIKLADSDVIARVVSFELFEDSYLYKILTPDGIEHIANEDQITFISLKYLVELPNGEQVERILDQELNYGDKTIDPVTNQEVRILAKL